VLHFGVSNFTPSQFELLSSRLSFPLVTNEVQFSVMYLASWTDGTLDLCQKLRISPMVWGPLGGGRLFTDSTEQVMRLRKVLTQIGDEFNATLDQVALSWLLKHPAKVIPILGAGNLEWIRNEVKAESVILSREHWFKIWVASTGEKLP
jgi:predicted oxidoreductase